MRTLVEHPMDGVVYPTAARAQAALASGAWIASTVGDALREAARCHPQRPAFIGDERSIGFAVSPLSTLDGKAAGYTLIFQDLTEMKKLEAELRLKDRMADGTTAASDDGALLQRVRQGDQAAMAEVFDRYGRAVYSVALRILKDAGHAEDVMQEIFFQIWRNSDSFVQGRGSLGAWLVVVARNRSIDLLRRRKPTDSVDDVVLASPFNLASEAEHHAMMEKVQKVMKDLPVEQQRSMELAFFDGLSHSEIAEKTGDPLGTVKTRIRLALISLRKAFRA